MHYIRFLKLPFLSNGRLGSQLNAKITITTDLGESFLSVDLPIRVIVLDAEGNRAQVQLYKWIAGKRDLEISISLSTQAFQPRGQSKASWRLLVQPRDSHLWPAVLGDLLKPSRQTHSAGAVMPILSDHFFAEPSAKDPGTNKQHVATPKRVARHIFLGGMHEFYIWEEAGESIARHIWDAGLVLAAFLNKCDASNENVALGLPKDLKCLMSKDKLEVLELGTGCGIVGITLANLLPSANVIITDMPEAEEIAKHNISIVAGQRQLDRSPSKIEYLNLDWEEPLPQTLRNGKMDLILVADCTYNSDSVPDLVRTLASLVKHNQNVIILVAMKIRHNSELVFFDLMKGESMMALDKSVLPLPLLGENAEEIELHLFKSI